MKLTGKCKEEFEKYLNKHKYFIISVEDGWQLIWDNCSKSMQYGVRVDYFKSKNIFVWVAYNEVARKWNWHISFNPVQDDCRGFPEYEPPEARDKAIQKANEIRNEQLK